MVTLGELQKLEGKKVFFVTDKRSVYFGRLCNARMPTKKQFEKGVVANVDFYYTTFGENIVPEQIEDEVVKPEIVSLYKASHKDKEFPIKFTDYFLDYEAMFSPNKPKQ